MCRHHHRCVCDQTGNPGDCLTGCDCFYRFMVEGLDFSSFFDDAGAYVGDDTEWGIGLGAGDIPLLVGDRIAI